MATFRRGHFAHKVRYHNDRILDKLAKQTTSTTPAIVHLSEAIPRELLILQLISRDGDRCYICQQTFEPRSYHIEHIIPRVHGGTDSLTNLALACQPCNYLKHDKIIAFRIADRIPCLMLPR